MKKNEDRKIALISLYVDDLIITRSPDGVIKSIKEQFSQVFDMKDLGQLHYCLGLAVWRDKGKNSSHLEQIYIGCSQKV